MSAQLEESLPKAAAARDRALREQVVVGARVIAYEGYADLTVGHISVCDRERGVMYIKRKGPAMSELEPSDVLVHPIEDDELLKQVPDMHFEAVMHTAVYRQRPDVNSVIHSHPPFATALGTTNGRVEMLAHDAMLFAEHGVPSFREHKLITDTESAEEMARALGPSRALLLRGHGVLVVGEDVRWAVQASLSLERAIKIQMIARMLGTVEPIPDDVAKAFFPRKYLSKKFVERPGFDSTDDKTSLDEIWDYWCRNVRKIDSAVPRQV